MKIEIEQVETAYQSLNVLPMREKFFHVEFSGAISKCCPISALYFFHHPDKFPSNLYATDQTKDDLVKKIRRWAIDRFEEEYVIGFMWAIDGWKHHFENPRFKLGFENGQMVRQALFE